MAGVPWTEQGLIDAQDTARSELNSTSSSTHDLRACQMTPTVGPAS